MNTVIDLADERTRRAIVLAAESGQWVRCTARDGRQLFGIPARKAGLHYLVDAHSCTCRDFVYRRGPCKHITAVRIVEALAA